jgi:outer membrane protein
MTRIVPPLRLRPLRVSLTWISAAPGRCCVELSRKGSALLFLWIFLLASILCILAVPDHLYSQEITSPTIAGRRDFFPLSLSPYRSSVLPVPVQEDTPGLSGATHDGTLELSLHDMLRAVVENNLELAAARYNLSMAETDLLRAKAGQAPRGTEGARIPAALFAGAIGAGVSSGGGGGGAGGGGGISGNARSVFVGPRGSYDPSVSFNFSWDRTTSPLNSIRISGIPNVSTASTAFQTRFSQAFTSGTSFSLSLNNQRQGSTQKFLLFNPSFTSSMNLSVNQQLLGGFGFSVNRRFERVAKINRSVTREVFRQRLLTLLATSQNRYWDLAAATRRVSTAEQALEVAGNLLSDNRRRVEVGTLSVLEVTAAEAEVATRRRDLIFTQTARQLIELDLKNLISREWNDSITAARIVPTDPLPHPKASDLPRLEDAVAVAMRDRPEIPQGEGGVLSQQVAVEFTTSRLKPTLSVFGVLASGGRESGLGQAFGQTRRLDFPEYAVGFALSFSLRNRAAQADDLRARMELRQAETSLARTRNRIRIEVRNASIGLRQSAAQVTAAVQVVELRRRNLDAEQRKLSTGTSVPYDVILAQRDLLAAELAEVEARVGYAKALVETGRVTARLLENAGISLEDAIQARPE